MNTKKIKITLISALFVCLFALNSLTVEATPILGTMEFPESIRADETFEIKSNWIYLTTTRCFYGDYIWLFYAVGVNPVFDYNDPNHQIVVDITGFPDFPTPNYTIIEVDMRYLYYTPLEGDIFRFKIKWIVGYYSGDDIGQSNTRYSEIYEISSIKEARTETTDPTETTTDPTDETGLPIIVFGIALFSLAAITIKRRKH